MDWYCVTAGEVALDTPPRAEEALAALLLAAEAAGPAERHAAPQVSAIVKRASRFTIKLQVYQNWMRRQSRVNRGKGNARIKSMDDSVTPNPEAKEEQQAPEQAATEAGGTADETREEPFPDIPLPPPTFEFLVLSLRSQAEMQLGLLHFGDEKDRPKPRLSLARHTIDMLAMLQSKTRGNLSLEESRLIENSLTELRFRYVQAAESRESGTK